jgi:hypothetical protein
MVWGVITRKVRLTLVFIDRRVKINAEYYKTGVLERILLPEPQKLNGDNYYCFQQDEAPSHTANIVQRWCEDNLTDFIPKDEWHPSSPDLNPLDFSFWDRNIPEHVVRAACDAFDKRLRLVIKAKGQSFE